MKTDRIIWMNLLAGVLGFLLIPHERYGPHPADIIYLWPECLAVGLYLYSFKYDRLLHKQRIEKLSLLVLMAFAAKDVLAYYQIRDVSVLSKMELFRCVVLSLQVIPLIVLVKTNRGKAFLLSFTGVTFTMTMLPFLYVVCLKNYSYRFIEHETASVLGQITALFCVEIHSFLCIHGNLTLP